MKEMNPLETQLRSWTPRRPSPGVERRLFCRHPFQFTVPKLVTVLVPTTACLVLTFISLKQQPLLQSGGAPAEMIAMSLSNQSYAPYLPGNSQSVANRVATFEWTNRGYSQSSVRSFTPTKGSDL